MSNQLTCDSEETVKYLASCGHFVCSDDVVFVRQGNKLIPVCISCYEAASDANSVVLCRV